MAAEQTVTAPTPALDAEATVTDTTSNAGTAAGAPLGAPSLPRRRDRSRERADALRESVRALQEPAGLIGGSVRPASRRDSLRRRLLALADVAALCAAAAIVWIATAAAPSAGDAATFALVFPAWVVLNKLLGLYDSDASLVHKSTLNELPAVAHSLTLGVALLFVASPLMSSVELDRAQALLFWGAGMALTPLARWGARSATVRRCSPERVLIVGSGRVAEIVARKLRMHPEYGVKLVGFVDVSASGRMLTEDGDFPMLGDLEQFAELCRKHDVERVVIAFSSSSHEHLLDAIRVSKLLNLKITVVPRLFEVIGHSVEVDQVEGMTMLGMRGLGRTRSSLMLKRAIDVTGATVGLVIFSPLMLCVALAVKLTSPGPVLFAQRRIGRDNMPFKLFKFRTMVDGASKMKRDLQHLNEASGPMFKISDDPRVTPFGRFLRKTSLDELPQLWNVLRGEMSLVGPRPLVPSEDGHVIGWHRTRLDLTPGLTGPWQVMGRTNIPFDEMVKLDYLYVTDWSLWNDIKLLLRTLPVVASRRGC